MGLAISCGDHRRSRMATIPETTQDKRSCAASTIALNYRTDIAFFFLFWQQLRDTPLRMLNPKTHTHNSHKLSPSETVSGSPKTRSIGPCKFFTRKSRETRDGTKKGTLEKKKHEMIFPGPQVHERPHLHRGTHTGPCSRCWPGRACLLFAWATAGGGEGGRLAI